MPQKAITFRVTHGDFSVTIVHPSVHTLEDLAESIIRSVYFDMDHFYGFYSNIKSVTPSEEEYTLFADIGEEVNEHDKGVRTTLLTDVFRPKILNPSGTHLSGIQTTRAIENGIANPPTRS